jgi:hypothetical protein
MHRILLFIIMVGTTSFLVNMYPALSGFKERPLSSISLILSTIAWFCYLCSLYLFNRKKYGTATVKKINYLLIVAIIFPLIDVVMKTESNAAYARGGLLPAVYTLLNYASRISLIIFSACILTKQADVLKIIMSLLAIMIFTSFITTVYGLMVFFKNDGQKSVYLIVSKTLDPIAILSIFLLQLYTIIHWRTIRHNGWQ